jgi:hypothetical protein
MITYVVPTTFLVIWVFVPANLDNPKSATFTTMFLSSNMLAGFKSKWSIDRW